MMKIAVAALIVASLAASLAHAQSGDESKVLALEMLWGQAAHLRDIRALESIFDDSLTYVHIDGRLMTKAQVLSDTKAVSPVTIIVDSSVAHSHGKVIIVTGVLHLKGLENGKPYLSYGRYLDTWLKEGEKWVCVSSMTTPMHR